MPISGHVIHVGGYDALDGGGVDAADVEVQQRCEQAVGEGRTAPAEVAPEEDDDEMGGEVDAGGEGLGTGRLGDGNAQSAPHGGVGVECDLAEGVADVLLPKEAVTHVESGRQGVVVPGLKNGDDGGQGVGG